MATPRQHYSFVGRTLADAMNNNAKFLRFVTGPSKNLCRLLKYGEFRGIDEAIFREAGFSATVIEKVQRGAAMSDACDASEMKRYIAFQKFFERRQDSMKKRLAELEAEAAAGGAGGAMVVHGGGSSPSTRDAADFTIRVSSPPHIKSFTEMVAQGVAGVAQEVAQELRQELELMRNQAPSVVNNTSITCDTYTHNETNNAAPAPAPAETDAALAQLEEISNGIKVVSDKVDEMNKDTKETNYMLRAATEQKRPPTSADRVTIGTNLSSPNSATIQGGGRKINFDEETFAFMKSISGKASPTCASPLAASSAVGYFSPMSPPAAGFSDLTLRSPEAKAPASLDDDRKPAAKPDAAPQDADIIGSITETGFHVTATANADVAAAANAAAANNNNEEPEEEAGEDVAANEEPGYEERWVLVRSELVQYVDVNEEVDNEEVDNEEDDNEEDDNEEVDNEEDDNEEDDNAASILVTEEGREVVYVLYYDLECIQSIENKYSAAMYWKFVAVDSLGVPLKKNGRAACSNCAKKLAQCDKRQPGLNNFPLCTNWKSHKKANNTDPTFCILVPGIVSTTMPEPVQLSAAYAATRNGDDD
eukprot:CAMPEP_0178551720 /NCGR_PEP_ID=MMETSP0697-20121206/6927_1 /TAXON_ID=265572 /ORGANISM="Extubocellulus spinifer, Strain CCMP396" /LENGTH=591 /DNA_ID=CAMNT_0020184575 /DNA_START=88 /DNA_END=1863 /DNA_ORIENTATION=-